MSEMVKELSKKIETSLKPPGEVNLQNGHSTKDIYVAIFHEGPVRREYRFYAPPVDLSITDEDPEKQDEKRRKNRAARIWRLCKRYEAFLKSAENKKVVLVGVPQPFVIDFEARMAQFESNPPSLDNQVG